MQEFHIAIIDDEPDLHSAIKLSLKNEVILGHQLIFHSASSAKEGVALLTSNSNIALVLLDMVMETDTAGFDFLNQLNQLRREHQPQVVLLSGQAADPQITSSLEINAYLTKAELTTHKLKAVLTTCLRSFCTINKLKGLTQELSASQQNQNQTINLLKETENLAQVAGWTLNLEQRCVQFTDGAEAILASCFDKHTKNARQKLQEYIIEAFELSEIANEDVIDVQVETENRSYLRIRAEKDQSFADTELLYGAVQNVTSYMDLLQKQANATSFLTNTLNSLSDALVVIDSDGYIISANPATLSLFDYAEEELLGSKVEVLMPEPYASRHKHYLNNHLRNAGKTVFGQSRPLPAKRKDGSTFPMELTLTEFSNSNGKRFIGVMRDMTQQRVNEKKIYDLAYKDKVTGLPNLAKFFEAIELEVERTLPLGVAVPLMLVDISGFYRINQAYGHDIGDQLLILLSDRIQWQLPDNAILYRSEGTDFIIHYKGNETDHEGLKLQLKELSERVFSAVAEEIYISYGTHKLSANIGISIQNAEHLDAAKIIHQLEIAAHKSKGFGRNQSFFYDNTLEREYARTFVLEQELSKAIERNELSLLLQPQYNKRHVMVCSEALLRWNNEKLGFISPAEFIPVAEESGLIVNIGRWVFNQACKYIAQSHQAGYATNIAVNVSAKEILQADFVNFVLGAITSHEVPASSITIEITESTLATDIEQVIENMKLLSGWGIRFSIDDFGTGYSSLSYLQRLPLDELKIDKAFIDDIVSVDCHVPIVDTIITMAKSLKLHLVAEGVEHEYQREYLNRTGSLLIQGYLYSKPLPYDDWLALLATSRLPQKRHAMA